MLTTSETSFSGREKSAEMELESGLNALDLSHDIRDKLYDIISDYTNAREEIQFSLGMKAGAKIVLLLTDKSEYDI